MSEPSPERRPIQVLSDDLASQIAAGEVVERPASVVKELVENALDAGAERVSISIEAGGIALIAVQDDGRGMPPNDAELCLARHATSKLTAFSELDDLPWYGFRGEALPSIASVSRLEVRTRHKTEQAGVQLLAEGTTEAKKAPCAHPVGTSLFVRDLFFNVPARRKFLRSSNTEAGHVSEVTADAALCRPDVSFVLERDGRTVRQFARVGSRAERAAQVLDEPDLLAISGQRGPVSVEAFLAPVERGRRGAGGLKFLINGRPVRDRALAATVAHAFGPALERGRYPRGVVYLDLPRRLVDINVHPQKAEVRFVDARAVCDALYGVIARGLSGSLQGGSLQGGSLQGGSLQGGSLQGGERPQFSPRSSAQPGRAPVVPAAPPLRAAPPELIELGQEAKPVSGQRYTSSSVQRAEPSPAPVEPRRPPTSADFDQARQQVNQALRSAERGARNLRFLGQASDSYLVCADADGIVILDQHAADEVSIFARLEQAYRQGGLQTQALLFPTTLTLSKKEVELVERHGALLYRLGLDVRVRSGGVVSLHGVMGALKRAGSERLLRAFLDAATSCKDDARLVEQFFATIACLEAIDRGVALGIGDAQALVKSLAGLRWDQAHPTCSHGRPLLTSTSYAELARKAGK